MTSAQANPPQSSMLSPIGATRLSNVPGIAHGFFTRRGGVSTGLYQALNCGLGSRDDADAVRENRSRAARHLGAEPSAIVTLYQVHGKDALVVERPVPRETLPRADAVVTRTPGLVVGVLTADCAPVLLADPEVRVVAAAHAGWRGAVGGVIESVVIAMEGLGARRDRIRAAVGPCIKQASYQVGSDFEAEVCRCDPESARFFLRTAGDDRPRFDLPGYVLDRLGRLGLADLEDASVCTYQNESLFFSYRRSQHRQEPDYGRQISAIVVT